MVNQGVEKLAIDVYPAKPAGGGSVVTDTNLDGYVLWVHADPGYPDRINGTTNFPSPYQIFFNGYLITDSFAITGPLMGYPILFGKTALLCQSYVGDVEKKNPLITEQSLKKPNIVSPPHGWGGYSAGIGPDGTTPQPVIPKTLGYWIFDFLNAHNPGSYVPFGNNNFDQLANLLYFSTPLAMTEGLYFKNSQPGKSPLVSRGKNGFSAFIAPSVKAVQEIEIIDVFVAEFYDRGKYRTASQSWTYTAQSNRSVRVNDSPLIYGVGNEGTGSSGGGMTFDLTPSYTSKGPNGDDSLLGPHSGLYFGSDELLGLNDDQIPIIKSWEDDCISIIRAFQAMNTQVITSLVSQIVALQPEYQQAYKATIIARQLAMDDKLNDNWFDDYYQLYYNTNTKKQIVNYTGMPPADQQIVLGNVILTYYDYPGHPNGPVLISETFGPTQTYYIDLSQPTSSYQDAVQNPIASFEEPFYTTINNMSDDEVIESWAHHSAN